MNNTPSKVKAKPGSKNEQGYKDKSGKNNFRRPVTRHKKFEGKTPDLKNTSTTSDMPYKLTSICAQQKRLYSMQEETATRQITSRK
eukprot:3116688-Ditylum_brightwellii.AAC.1